MRRASGSLFGLAYGDALGRPTEFLTVAEFIDRYGPGGPRDLPGDPGGRTDAHPDARPALVTDDTQMALAVGWALHDAPGPTPEAVAPLLRERFVSWAASPDNNRAPGQT
jgi:ADP-ribosylglycohydrolase